MCQPATALERGALHGGITQLCEPGEIAHHAALELHRDQGDVVIGVLLGHGAQRSLVLVGPERQAGQMPPAPLVLASSSTYRAELLASVGIRVTVDPAHIDERAADDLFSEIGADGLALELARRKAWAVAPRHPGCWVLAADQIGVLGEGAEVVMLTKQPDIASATAQLVAMSGSTHRLVNGVVLVDVDSGRSAHGVDVQRVTMNAFDQATARRYVERFEPFDCSGSYRLEDQESMATDDRLLASVDGEDPSGVLGLPLPLLARLVAELAVSPA